jgi:hypothetical protein
VDNLAVLIDDLEKLIRDRPEMKATELAMALYGPSGYYDRIGGLCRQLFQAYRIERRGNGGAGNPFRYYPAQETKIAGNSNQDKELGLVAGLPQAAVMKEAANCCAEIEIFVRRS